MPGIVETARALATDGACADAVAALRAEGIDPILIKGPTIASWLYPGEVRGYVDADLLVAPRYAAHAKEVLARLGYEPPPAHLIERHSEPWIRRRDRAEIDLHISLWGAHRPPSWVWDELQSQLTTMPLASETVQILDQVATTLCVVLHAAQHDGAPKQREDLVRALALTPSSLWQEVERLAHRLWALVGFAQGLALVPEGQTVLAELPLARAGAIVHEAPLAIGFARIAQARGMRAKLRVVADVARAPHIGDSDELGHELASNASAAAHRLRLLGTAPRTMLVLWRAHRRAGAR